MVRDIVEKYHGVLDIKDEGSIFRVILLCMTLRKLPVNLLFYI